MLNDYMERLVKFCRIHKRGLKIFIFVFFVGGMLLRGVMQYPVISALKNDAARLEKQIEYEKGRQEEVERLKEKVGSDEYIEKIAREKLGLEKSNAKIFVDVSGE